MEPRIGHGTHVLASLTTRRSPGSSLARRSYMPCRLLTIGRSKSEYDRLADTLGADLDMDLFTTRLDATKMTGRTLALSPVATDAGVFRG